MVIEKLSVKLKPPGSVAVTLIVAVPFADAVAREIYRESPDILTVATVVSEEAAV